MRAPRRRSRWSSRWDPPDYEWLYDQYVTQEKPLSVLALETNAGIATLWRWLKAEGIPRRAWGEGGDKHPKWQGGSSWYWREQAKRALREAGTLKVCGMPWVEPLGCGKKEHLGVHHIDEDIRNNALENLQYLCPSCHKLIHFKLKRQRSRRKLVKLMLEQLTQKLTA